MISDDRSALALAGSIAQLIGGGLDVESTLPAITDTLRRGLGAERVRLWVRGVGATTFGAVSSPAAPAPARVTSLDAVEADGRDVRFPLQHGGQAVGLLEARTEAGSRERETLNVVCLILAPYLASLELSEDLAGEVVAQSREIEEHRRFTGLIIDSLPIGLYVVDREYRIQMWNRKRETGTQGLRRDAVVGRPVFEVLTRQPAEQLKEEFDRVFRTGEIQQSEQEVTLGDEVHVFRLSKIPMRLDRDAITHVITIGEDVTDSRAVQGRIMQSEKLAAVGQLAAGVMHEINNPLATIGACVAAMQGKLEDGQVTAAALNEYLDIIDREVERCSKIVDGLLDFSRPKGQSKTSLSVPTLVDDTLFLLKHHQRFKRMAVERELEPGVPRVLGNKEQLIQALMALLLNAVDAMEQAGRLTVRAARAARGDEVVVEVEDTGVGIPRENQAKIFEPFYTTKQPGRGTGLGLSICYGIIEAHRGRIELDSIPGQGATFRVYLPVAP
ncbi:MAG TPA: ATP-binding protein [Gemmatimonadales bacterium]